jgi:hypothetical protein
MIPDLATVSQSQPTIRPGCKIDRHDGAADATEQTRWRCQSNANQSPKCEAAALSGRQLTPFGQRGEAVLLEDVAAVEVTVEIRMVMNGSVDGGKLLQGLDAPEICHRPFPSSERLV